MWALLVHKAAPEVPILVLDFMRHIGLLGGRVSEGLSPMQVAALDLFAQSWAPPSGQIGLDTSSTPCGHESTTVAGG